MGRILFVIFLVPLLVFSQSDDDWGDIEDLEIIDSTRMAQPTFSNYWDEHFYGSIAGMYSMGMNHSRQASEIKLGYNEHWHHFKFVLEGAYRQNLVRTKYETMSGSKVIESGEMDLKYSSFSFRQAYVDVYPIKSLTVSVGRQTNVWGQLDIFSPVDFLLPIDINPMGFSLIKADNRMPQTTIKVLYYPLSNIEVSGYFFPRYEESDLFKTIKLGDSSTEYNGKKYYTQKILPTGDQQSSSAARVTWYAPFMTSALTYYQGFNNVFPVFRKKYLGAQTINASTDFYFQNEYGYYPKTGVGAEVSIPMGKMSLKAEAALADEYQNIDYNKLKTQPIVDAINQYNNGYDTIPIYQAFFAVGIDADFDHWFYNFYLMNITYFKNPAMSEFWDVYESIYGKHEFMSLPVFPTLNVGRYLSDEKKGAYGFALGYFTGSLGMFVYLSNEINESLTWGVSADAGFNFSDFALLSSNQGDDDEYKSYKFIEPKITLGLGYKL